jgi:pilus assembly protein Flp/PilA
LELLVRALAKTSKTEKTTLKMMLQNLNLKIRSLMECEEGQDLVEYALLITMVALAAVSGMKHVASAINTVFTNISSTLA